MGERTGISWTDSTFNPWMGCSKVSPGCQHCYAERESRRYGHDIWGPGTRRRELSDAYWRQPARWQARAKAAGRRHLVFCGSMCDLFEDHRDQAVAARLQAIRMRLWSLMDTTPDLIWLLLTKRPQNVDQMVPSYWMDGHWPENAWLGTSVENQAACDERLRILVRLPAPVRFLSAEPLLGPVTIADWLWAPTGRFRRQDGVRQYEKERADTIDWVIVGGESGPGCRHMDLRWAAALVRECQDAQVPVFVKQLGGHPDKHPDVTSFPPGLAIRQWPPHAGDRQQAMNAKVSHAG